MEDLRLNQTIFADSTCYFDGEVVDIRKTTLVDAVMERNNLEITLGKGHWGCVPTRTRSSVIAKKSDIRPFIDKKIEARNKKSLLERSKSLNELLENGEILLYVEKKNDTVALFVFYHSRTYSSLAEGNKIEFTQKYKKLTLSDLNKLPVNVFNNLEKATKYLEKTILNEL